MHIDELRYVADRWRADYNRYRPHSSPGDLTPVEFAESGTASGQPTAVLQQYRRATSNVKFA